MFGVSATNYHSISVVYIYTPYIIYIYMYPYMLDGKQKTKCMLGRLSHPRHPKSALGGPAGYSSVQVSASSSAEAKA